MVCYELMSLISCSSIPTSLPERKSQSQLSIQQQLRMGGDPHTRSSPHRNSVCLLNGVTRRRCASNTIAFGTQTSGGGDDQVSSQFLVGRLTAPGDSIQVS